MLVLEPAALGGAGVADRGAEAANLLGMHAPTGHKTSGERAKVRAILQQGDAVRPGGGIGFLETGLQTFLADLHTAITLVDAVLILYNRSLEHRHGASSFCLGILERSMPRNS